MSYFAEALESGIKGSIIPEEDNLFGQFVGAWDFEWVDHHGTTEERHIMGEWIFSYVLEGTAVQDIFICPSRKERLLIKQPDAEYGTTIRIYNPKSRNWDIFYGCSGEAVRLEAVREGAAIVLTEINDRKMKWVFSDITKDSFHWQHLRTQDGCTFTVRGELFAVRRS